MTGTPHLTLTPKQQVEHRCILSIVPTDALALKHHDKYIDRADYIFIAYKQFHREILQL